MIKWLKNWLKPKKKYNWPDNDMPLAGMVYGKSSIPKEVRYLYGEERKMLVRELLRNNVKKLEIEWGEDGRTRIKTLELERP